MSETLALLVSEILCFCRNGREVRVLSDLNVTAQIPADYKIDFSRFRIVDLILIDLNRTVFELFGFSCRMKP